MNRNLLLAIAAVAAIGIVAGLVFVGSGPSPAPLTGALGTAATTLTLNASTCSVADGAGNVSFTLSGELRNATGAGVSGRTIALRTARCAPDGCSVAPAMDFATTGPDGGFSFVKSEPATPGYGRDTYSYYRAAFAGDSAYGSSASGEARKLC